MSAGPRRRTAAVRSRGTRSRRIIGATAQTPTTVTGSPPATSTTVSGLTNGTAYTFTVTATNAVGHRAGVRGLERGHPGGASAARRARSGRRRRPPSSADEGDPSSTELGVKFTVGRATGRSPGSGSTRAPATPAPTSGTCGPRPGRSWRRRPFTGETASGWQQVNFATPVAITAGTVYVASYFAPDRALRRQTAATSPPPGVDNAPLHALQDGVERRQRRLPVRHRQRASPTSTYNADELLGRRRVLHRGRRPRRPRRPG